MDILSKIISKKIDELNQLKKSISISELENSEFFERNNKSIVNGLIENDISIIAEHKRKSPSRSEINSQTPTEKIINGYQEAGAVALSILTEKNFFNGSTNDILNARKITELPILRKDFIIDEFQVIESKSFGADVILLIAAILNKNKIKKLSSLAKSLGLEVLLEIHDIKELNDYYLNNIDIIGVNNRNLKDFSIDINISKKISDKIPKGFKKISESGISDINVIRDLKNYGYSGFLIGEKFMMNHKKESICHFIKNINNET